jgi:hypothetical protein
VNKKNVQKEADALVGALMERIASLVETAVEERLSETEKRILEALPKVIELPPHPAEAFEERLLGIEEIAEMLGCSKDTVKDRMAAGVLTYIIVGENGDRKMPRSWVLEYIYGHTRFTGPKKERREVAPDEGQGADCRLRLVRSA